MYLKFLFAKRRQFCLGLNVLKRTTFIFHEYQPMNTATFMLLVSNYSTGVQIVSCTLSDDSVFTESTGLFNPVLCVSQWNLSWQKNQPMRLCLSNQVRPGREWFSPLSTWWLQQAFWRPYWIIIPNMTLKYVFLMTSVWHIKCKFVSLLCW